MLWSSQSILLCCGALSAAQAGGLIHLRRRNCNDSSPPLLRPETDHCEPLFADLTVTNVNFCLNTQHPKLPSCCWCRRWDQLEDDLIWRFASRWRLAAVFTVIWPLIENPQSAAAARQIWYVLLLLLLCCKAASSSAVAAAVGSAKNIFKSIGRYKRIKFAILLPALYFRNTTQVGFQRCSKWDTSFYDDRFALRPGHGGEE